MKDYQRACAREAWRRTHHFLPALVIAPPVFDQGRLEGFQRDLPMSAYDLRRRHKRRMSLERLAGRTHPRGGCRTRALVSARSSAPAKTPPPPWRLSPASPSDASRTSLALTRSTRRALPPRGDEGGGADALGPFDHGCLGSAPSVWFESKCALSARLSVWRINIDNTAPIVMSVAINKSALK